MAEPFLHYTRQGGGPPLLLLHGNGEDGSYFVHQMDAFSLHYTVYAIDTRGHGRSPRGDAPFTMEQFARDLLEFMDEEAIQRANILGFSDGGNIALTFALAHPERVDRLILNGANLDPSGVKLHIQLPIVLGYAAASLFGRMSPKAKHNAEILGLMVKEPHIPAQALETLYIPTLVIVGTRDMIRDAHTLLIAGSLPLGRLEMIVGDHFIAAKSPDEFNEAVAAFLADTRSDCI
ncbi:MAG: alpha/beta fold hydrolase [Oscillospiraceae bacterium]|nr:alpha/beta fold hydrolase [Oscillospiraceae bacterium]